MDVGPYPRIFHLGDSAITVEFGNMIEPELNLQAIGICRKFDENPFTGMIETVPAYASATIFYDAGIVRRQFPQFKYAAEAVVSFIRSALSKPATDHNTNIKTIEIPVDFSASSGPDLEYVAIRSGITVGEVISIFTGAVYRVYMLGFLPGFTYMGEVDGQIATPRRDVPRTSVQRGSVGIAGRQTGVYSLESPGGWQIIGRTEVPMFRPELTEPCLLDPGDFVKFVSI